MADPIRFKDMAARDEAERKRLGEKREFLISRATAAGAKAPSTTGEAKRIGDFLSLSKYPVLDQVYTVLCGQFEQTGQAIGEHAKGLLASQLAGGTPGELHPNEKAFAATYGILVRDGKFPRAIDDPLWKEPNDDQYQRFIQAVAEARGEYNARRELYDRVLDELIKIGTQGGQAEVDTAQWARVGEALFRQRISATDYQLGLRVEAAITGGFDSEDGAASAIEISLPDLDAQANVEIVRDNLMAIQALYFSAALDDMLFFGVAEKVRELFQLGMLPFGKSRGGDLIFAFAKKGINRMTEVERRNLYARTFGFPGGDPNVTPNREFSDLWLRFVSGVSEIARQISLDDLLRSTRPGSVSQEHVRKSGRDLAANLSLHGYGIGYFAATELQATIRDVIDILSSDDVMKAYGARDMYQVIDQVAALELGGARNTTRYRTIAQAGAVIIAWLAKRAELLASTGRARILDLNSIYNGSTRPAGVRASDDPTDADLVDACEQWLAVTGTADAQVEQYSQAADGPAITSRPIQIPSVARDLLASVGVPANGH